MRPEIVKGENMPPDLYPADRLILKLCCEMEIEGGQRGADLRTETIFEKAEREGVGRDEAAESIEHLKDERYIKGFLTDSEVPYVVTVTDAGFDVYGHSDIRDYNARVGAVEDQIVNHDKRVSTEVADALDESIVIVERIFGGLEAKGDVELSPETGPLRITHVSVGFKRRLRPS
jgi:hypothetical protein